MKPLFSRIKVGDTVRGKMTKKLYRVWRVDPTVEPHEDAVILLDVTNTKNQVEYTERQFNVWFIKVRQTNS